MIPTFALGHLFRGYQLKMASDPRFSQPLEQSLHAAEQTAGNAREQAHVAALKAWQRNDTDKTSAILGEILAADPTDLIALKAANHLHFYRGDAHAMLAAIQRQPTPLAARPSLAQFYCWHAGLWIRGVR